MTGNVSVLPHSASYEALYVSRSRARKAIEWALRWSKKLKIGENIHTLAIVIVRDKMHPMLNFCNVISSMPIFVTRTRNCIAKKSVAKRINEFFFSNNLLEVARNSPCERSMCGLREYRSISEA